MPAFSLVAQRLDRLGDLGPHDRIGNEGHVVALSPFAEEPVDADRELEVLGDRVLTVASDGQHEPLLPQAEGAGDQHVPPESIPAEPTEQKGPEVLRNLEGGQPTPRDAWRHRHPTAEVHPVGDADGAAGAGHRLPAYEHDAGQAAQGARLHDRIRVDDGAVWIAGRVHGHVERRGASRHGALLLVHHQESGLPAGAIVAADGRRGETVGEGRRDGIQVERLGEQGQGPVRGGVVDDDHLVVGIVEVKQRVHAGDDDGLLVEGRNEHGDGWEGPLGETAREPQPGCQRPVLPHLEHGEREQDPVEQVQGAEVPQKDRVPEPDEPAEESDH